MLLQVAEQAEHLLPLPLQVGLVDLAVSGVELQFDDLFLLIRQIGGHVGLPAAQQRKLQPRRFATAPAGLRYAFYGRMSTVDYQDRASSCRWQRNYADDLIADHGRIGEYERAFHGRQLEQLAPIPVEHGIQLWLPETYGPVDFDNPRQLALLDLLGVHSQREVSGARHRTTAVMRAQAELQGRHLGGRPPYGYQLVDAGPHPNRAHAAWGRRLHRLEPDLATAPHVRWIFEQRLAGRSVASIARASTTTACPVHPAPTRRVTLTAAATSGC